MSGKIVLSGCVTKTGVSLFFLQLMQPDIKMVSGREPSSYDWMYSGLPRVL